MRFRLRLILWLIKVLLRGDYAMTPLAPRGDYAMTPLAPRAERRRVWRHSWQQYR